MIPTLTYWEGVAVTLFLDALKQTLTYVYAGGAYPAAVFAAQRSIDALSDLNTLLDARVP